MTPRRMAYTVMLLVVVLSLPAAEEKSSPDLPPAELFFQPPEISMVKISPSGTHICALQRFDDYHYQLILVTGPAMAGRARVKANDMSLKHFWWKTDDLLLLLLQADDGQRDFRTFDLRTGKFNELDALKSYSYLEFISDLPDDPDSVLFKCVSGYADRRAVISVNLKTGRDVPVEVEPSGVHLWLLDRAGKTISAWGILDQQEFLVWRQPGASNWQRKVLAKDGQGEITPLGLAPDQRRLLAIDYRQNSKGRVCYYDPAGDSMEEIVAPREVEPSRLLRWGSRQEPGAILYDAAEELVHFLLPEAEAVHIWLEKVLPGTRRQYVSFSRDNSRIIVLANQDRTPGVYCLADVPAKKITLLGPVQRGLKPATLAPVRPFHFQTSDRETITGQITLPNGMEHPPLVIGVGPGLTGVWQPRYYDELAQFYASRGYAFARVNHRGVAGFGRDFTNKGDFQFATGIARDVREAAQWLVEQDWVDHNRIAVFGEDWGAVVAFASATSPSLFRALLNFNGPIDLTGRPVSAVTLSNRSRTDLIAAGGGLKAVQAYGKSISPLTTAEHVRIPSFHFYWDSDWSSQIKKLGSVLQKQGSAYEIAAVLSAEQMKHQGLRTWEVLALRHGEAVDFLNRQLPPK